MECKTDKTKDNIFNISSFSKMIGQDWGIGEERMKNYFFANISAALVRNMEMREEINVLYLQDKLRYYNAANSSECIKHIIMTQGTLEQELYSRRVLGILIEAEYDFNLRDKIVKLLKKYYPLVFKAVKKHSLKELKNRYSKMNLVTRETEARIDSAVYFYISMYRSSENVDQECFISVINSFKEFEFFSPITTNVSEEIEACRAKIETIKQNIVEEYGDCFDYKNILIHKNKAIEELGTAIENLFIINKVDISQLFGSLNNRDIDEIILSYIKTGSRNRNSKDIIQSIVCDVFIKYLINEYKSVKKLFLDNNREALHYKIDVLENELNTVKAENEENNNKLNAVTEEKALFNENLNSQVSKLNKVHQSEINEMRNRINELEEKLHEESQYRNELNALRNHIFQVNNEYIPKQLSEPLEYYIDNINMLVIGGTKEWRRRFREKHPEIRTLNGYNENFDVSILINYDFVFFYTGFMNHATYYKAMNYIRTNQLKFGYIGKTNIELVEDEIIEELNKILSNTAIKC